MSFTEDVTAITGRIAKAELERDRFLAAGKQDRYLEACSMVEALELQLERQHQAALSAKRENERMLADFRIAERIHHNAERTMADAPENREQLMLAFAIAFDGRQYVYDRYRYDRLADAVNYARLRHAHPASDPIEGPPLRGREPRAAPSDAQRELMSALGITLQAGVYCLGAYRYDRLSDAIEFARIKRVQ